MHTYNTHTLRQNLLFQHDWSASHSVKHLNFHCTKFLVLQMCILKFCDSMIIPKTQNTLIEQSVYRSSHCSKQPVSTSSETVTSSKHLLLVLFYYTAYLLLFYWQPFILVYLVLAYLWYRGLEISWNYLNAFDSLFYKN